MAAGFTDKMGKVDSSLIFMAMGLSSKGIMAAQANFNQENIILRTMP